MKHPHYSPPCPPPVPSGCSCGESRFLLPKILASGKMHRHRQCYPLCLSCLPREAAPPFTVADAIVCGQPVWQEIPCHERGGILLSVTLPLSLSLRDANGCPLNASSSIEEKLRLRFSCRENECWRGQIYVQGAVRLCGCGSISCDGCGDVPLEVMLEGYILAPCQIGSPACPPPCPEGRPWYPQPRFDPWNNR